MWLARQKFLPLLDTLTNRLVHKSLSQRSERVQLIAVLVSALLVSVFVFRLISLLKNKKPVRILCVLLCAILISILCFLQTLRRDDYWEIRDAVKYGFPGFIRYEYVNICGRYFSLFLKSLYPFFLPDVNLFINCLLIASFLLLFAGCCLLLKLIPGCFTAVDILGGGMMIALGIIFMSPNIWEVWFWGGGTFIYGIGNALTIIAASLMISLELGTENLTMKTIAAAVCIFCACGTSELNAASVCALSLLIFFVPKIIFGRKLNRRNACLVLFSWVLTLLVLFTSGNLKGAGQLYGYETYMDIMTILRVLPEKLLVSVNSLCQYFLARIEYALIFMSLAILAGICPGTSPVPVKITCTVAVCLIITAIGVLCINSILDFMPPRVISIPMAWVILAFMLLAYHFGTRFRQLFFLKTDLTAVSALLPLVLLTVAGWFYLNHVSLVRDIRDAWIERDRELHSFSGTENPVETCAIPVLGSAAADPGEDPGGEFNIVTAYYYDIPSVTANHLCSPFGER